MNEKEKYLSENEEEEVLTITDENGNTLRIRFIKSFTAKLILAPEETKQYYEELKNEALSYRKVSSRVSWNYDAFSTSKVPLIKFAIRGKTLALYFALNADDYIDSKYKVEKMKSKKHLENPCLYRIKNKRRLAYAKELIADCFKKHGLVKGEERHNSYRFPRETTKSLIEKGLIKESKTQIKSAK